MGLFDFINNLLNKYDKKDISKANKSPIIVEMVNDEPGSLIAKLSLAPGERDNLIKRLSKEPGASDIKQITLPIKSRTSKDVCYGVTFSNRNGKIDVKCDCQAGELTKLCWHKLALTRGDSSMLADFCNMNEFRRLQEWLKNSPFKKLISDHDKAEKIASEAQKVLKLLKVNIEDAMRKGI
ncbi:MAG: hypothetical protein ABSC45_08375 [Desulfobaccales bacterium]|jgi:hypothetical protein